MKTQPLKSKTALVTGANRGIGFAIAEGIAENKNIKVLVAARKLEEAERTTQKIGNGSIPVGLDLSISEKIEPQLNDIESNTVNKIMLFLDEENIEFYRNNNEF